MVCAIPVSHLILSVAQNITAEKEITVPDLKGKTVEQATEQLDKLKLKLEVGDKVSSSEYDEGEIVSQNPDADMSVKEGYTITVNISKGKAEQGTVPDVLNKSFASAKYLIESYGYVVGEITPENSELPKDVVIRQTPDGGTEAKPGAKVDLVVSQGKEVEQVPMPDVRGKSLDAAKDELLKAGLTISSVGKEMSTAYNANTVMWQQYDPGTMVDKGSGVNLKVSTGDQPAGSKSIPLTVDFGKANNEVFSLTVVISDESGVRIVINKEQRFKSKGSEILSLSGDGVGTVQVMFDNDVVLEKDVDFNTGEIN